MDDVADTADTAHTKRTGVSMLAASLAGTPDPVELAYEVLDRVAGSHGQDDAHLVLRPDGMDPRIFRLHRLPVAVDGAAVLLGGRPGLYAGLEPIGDEDVTLVALACICNLALAAQVARRATAIDPTCGLAGREVVEASLARVAARAARHGWTSTVVLLTAIGEGDPAERWSALCRAVRQALRAEDEVGVAGSGRALAILSGTGPDVVRPFVARVRAALTAAGESGVDVLAATASTPRESVDPDELWRLASERLGRPDQPSQSAASTGTVPSSLELTLRVLPGVVSVGTAPPGHVTVVALDPSDGLQDDANRRVHDRMADATVRVVAVQRAGAPTRSGPGASVPSWYTAAPAGEAHRRENGNRNGESGTGEPVNGETDRSPFGLSSGSPGGESAPGDPLGVSVLAVTFDQPPGQGRQR